MNNEIKFQHIKRLWYLKDGVIYTRWGNKEVSFLAVASCGRHYQKIKVNSKRYNVYEHEAVFMLYHDRPIADGKEIHHIDGNYLNNAIENLVELTRTQHKRIHQYQSDNPLRKI